MNIWQRSHWLTRVRRMAVGNLLLKVLSPVDRRQIFTLQDGWKSHADPFSNLGDSLKRAGTYEPDVGAILPRLLKLGRAFLVIGANQEMFSVLAGILTAPNGLVVAVEPQRRRQDLIEMNTRLNGLSRVKVLNQLCGSNDGERGEMYLNPGVNTGGSSIARSYRLSRSLKPGGERI